MNLIKKVLSKILYGMAKLLSMVLDGLIQLIEAMVFYISGFLKGCLALVSMGGCLFFIFFLNMGMRMLMDPLTLPLILFLYVFLMFGGKFVSYLKYVKYITTEFLYHTANYLVDPKSYQYKVFSEFKSAYRRAEEERIKQQQARYYEWQRQWEEQFRQNWYRQNYQGHQGGYSGYGGQSYGSSSSDFKYKYEKSCDILGVPYNADKQEIKSAYRKKAKEYHPDLCKLPDATKIFQEITAAYEFLNDDNRQRYHSMQ